VTATAKGRASGNGASGSFSDMTLPNKRPAELDDIERQPLGDRIAAVLRETLAETRRRRCEAGDHYFVLYGDGLTESGDVCTSCGLKQPF
jgi:hypothetical protein